jgi:hypothetical protein
MRRLAFSFGLSIAFLGHAAGAGDLLDPWNAQYRRELRTLQQQQATDPTGAASGAAAAQRQIRQNSGGVFLSPERRRLDRQLGAVGAATATDSQRAPARVPGTKAVRPDLPNTYGDDNAPLPSMQPLFTVGALLDRAQAGIADGRPASARSDLSIAQSQLSTLRQSGDFGADDPDLGAAEARAAALGASLGQ